MKQKIDFDVAGIKYPLKDYYAVLGFNRQEQNVSEISPDQIKRAYRSKALTLHPDKNSAPEATEQFKALGAANEILSDPVKHRALDEALQAHPHLGLQTQLWINLPSENGPNVRIDLMPLLAACQNDFVTLS